MNAYVRFFKFLHYNCISFILENKYINMNLKIVGSVHEEEKCKYSKGILYIPR